MNQNINDQVSIERSRVADITALCRKFNIDTAAEVGLIRDGVSMEKAREKILDELATRDSVVSIGMPATVGHSWDAGPGLIDKLSDALGARIAARSGAKVEPTKGREFADLSLRAMVEYAAKARGEYSFDPTFADAILDRIVHNAYRLELEGQSMRKTVAKMDDETPQT